MEKINKEKTIKDLSEREFSELLQQNLMGNQIQLGGTLVASQNSSLKEVENCANRLIKKQKDFLTFKRDFGIKTGYFD